MIVCVAKDYQTFAEWLERQVVYVGDKDDLAALDPATVKKVHFVGSDFRDHPIYFSDELLQFQCDVARAHDARKPRNLFDRLLGR